MSVFISKIKTMSDGSCTAHRVINGILLGYTVNLDRKGVGSITVEESIAVEGSKMRSQSYKHDGSIQRVWSETTILKGTDHVVIGGNNRSLVTESDGRKWVTREPAIV